jgi:tetratricopeptide (TPR) repeat protein
MLRFARLLLVLVSLLVTACASLAPPEPGVLLRDGDFRQTVLPPTDDILAVSAEMRRYLDTEIAPQLRREGRLRGLVTALEKNAQLKLEYDAKRTRTAAEAFAARRGNCLSLTLMASALARELGLTVSYRKVLISEPWARHDDLLVRSGHVNLALETNRMVEPATSRWGDGIIIDFLPHAELAGQRAVYIDESTVLAMYLSNRAAESLVTGDFDTAYAWARQAITVAPRYLDAYNTLGVVYLRRRMLDSAEQVFGTVLAQEPDNVTAIANLVNVLDQRGSAAAATQWRTRLQSIEDRPPFYYFDRGVAALKASHFQAAREYFAKELARNADYGDALFGLAVANVALGKSREAERYLRQAIDAAVPGEEKDLYSAKLAWIRRMGDH